MATDGQGRPTKCRRNIAENCNRLSSVHERYRETDRQTDGRATAYSERREKVGAVAQRVQHWTCDQYVAGLNPYRGNAA